MTLPAETHTASPAEATSAKTSPPRWLRRLPNQLTLLRILCIPVVVWLMLQGMPWTPGARFDATYYDIAGAAIFALAATTDFFDGWIARRYGVESLLGKLLDPVADKLLVVSALIILVDKHRHHSWIAVVLIVRDLGINAVRIAALEEKRIIHSSGLGKAKTALLDIGIVGLMINATSFLYLPARTIGLAFVWAAMVASVVSGIQYLWEYAKDAKSTS